MSSVPCFRPLPVLAVASLGVLLTSCAVGPDYKRPEIATPTAFKEAAPAAQPQVLADTWWTLFGDAELTKLVERGLAANLDLKVAVARLDQAQALTRSSRGDLFPSAALAPTARRARAVSSGVGRVSESYALPVSLSYEVDLWGRVRRQLEYYRGLERASQAELAVVRQTVASDIVTGYFTLGLYDLQLDILEKNLGLFREQLVLTETKSKAGLALPTDLLQARTQLNSATNQLIDVRRARVKQEHAVAVLLGEMPSTFSLPRRALAATIPLAPSGLPSDVLNRRPDVAAAEQTLLATNARIGIAQANFLPSITLTGSGGFQSSALDDLTDWSNRVWSIGPSINLPLFQGGQLRAALAQSRAAYEQQVATYRSTVLQAFQDVEDQLSDLALLAEKATSLEETLASAREYSRLTELQYRQGLTTYLQVIDANQTLLTNELSAAQTLNQRLAATVLLVRALGGGWQGLSD